jgi:hypothetical protein
MNDLQELESILRDLLGVIQEVLESGEQIDDEVQGAVADTLELLMGRIEQLRGSGAPTPQGPTKDEIAPGMPSSNVEGFAYDPKTNKLLVRFLGKHPDRNGPIYGYDKVPPQIFDLLRKGAVPARTDGQNKWGKWWKGKVPSLGASLYTLIKEGGYNYRRLS